MGKPLVIATKNAGKVEELRDVLGALGFDPRSLRDLPESLEIVEDADTFEGNALKKARAVLEAFSLPALADDSGLEVDALGGAPGVFSARYGGAGLDDAGRTRHLLEALRDVPKAARTARFRCALAFAAPGVAPVVFHGVFEGSIGFEPRGSFGFGYDPVFVPLGFSQTLAELSPAQKNSMSHRARALAAFETWAKANSGLYL